MAHRSFPPPEPSEPDLPIGTFHDRSLSELRRMLAAPDRNRLVPVSAGTLAAVVVALVVVIAVGWWFLRPAAPPIESSLPMASASSGSGGGGAEPSGGGAGAADGGGGGPATSAPTTAVPKLVVQAAGQVNQPGVYRLDPGARVVDLVEAAGGLTETADRARVNLAAPVGDGERVWFPAKGEAQPPDVVAGTAGGSGSGGATSPGGSAGADTPAPSTPVNLNTASAEELDGLPGIGPATAAAILAYRDAKGSFASVDELLDVRGIGEAKLEQLRPLVHV